MIDSLTSQRRSRGTRGGPFVLTALPIMQHQLWLTAPANQKIWDTLWVISSINCLRLQVAFQFPQRCFQSKYITPIAKRFLPLAGNSTIYPRIGAQNPPIGLYILILTAVGLEIRSSYVVNYYLFTGRTRVQGVHPRDIQGTASILERECLALTWGLSQEPPPPWLTVYNGIVY